MNHNPLLEKNAAAVRSPLNQNIQYAETKKNYLDDLDYLLANENEENNLESKIRRYNYARYFVLLMFLGGLIITASSGVCAVYIWLTYQDVHSSYTSIQNINIPVHEINKTDVDFIKSQMLSIHKCITERYCKRFENMIEEETNQESNKELL